MDNISAGIVGALIAIGGGVAFRVLEASNQRQHWFRDQMREAAERFLTDAQKHLDITWLKIIGELPDGSEAIRPPTSALEMDISRLQLVAPRPVNDVAADIFKKLRVAFNAAQMASSPFDERAGPLQIKRPKGRASGWLISPTSCNNISGEALCRTCVEGSKRGLTTHAATRVVVATVVGMRLHPAARKLT
jgi:hypothetical protein